MKFTVNGNEIEIYKDKIEFYDYSIEFYDYSIECGDIHCRSYYRDIIIINVNNGKYELEIFKYDLLEAILSLENMETFKEFVNTYDNLEKIKAKEEEYFSTYKEAKEEEEEEVDKIDFIYKGFYRGRKK